MQLTYYVYLTMVISSQSLIPVMNHYNKYLSRTKKYSSMVSKYWAILKAGTIKLFNFCNSDIGGINDLLDEEIVYPSQNVKFLGVLPDDRLNYHSPKQRILETYVFINVHISILRTFKHTISSEVFLSAYYGIIFPYMHYSVLVWGSKFQRILFMFRLQTKIV